MKMLREESDLRSHVIRDDYFIPTTKTYNKEASRLITAFRRAVVEDCAKIVEGCGNDEVYESIADAIRKGKPTQQCTSCGLFSSAITINGECLTCVGSHL